METEVQKHAGATDWATPPSAAPAPWGLVSRGGVLPTPVKFRSEVQVVLGPLEGGEGGSVGVGDLVGVGEDAVGAVGEARARWEEAVGGDDDGAPAAVDLGVLVDQGALAHIAVGAFDAQVVVVDEAEVDAVAVVVADGDVPAGGGGAAGGRWREDGGRVEVGSELAD